MNSERMVFSENTVYIDDSHFGNPKLKEVIFKGPLLGIPMETFRCCSSLTSVSVQGWTIGGTPPQRFSGGAGAPFFIGEGAFRFCREVKALDLENVILSKRAFEGTGIETLTLRQTPVIPGSCFASCWHLVTADIQGTVMLEYGAFDACMALTDLHVSDDLFSLSKLAFTGCINLGRIHLHHVKNPDRIIRALKPCLNHPVEYMIDE